MKAKFLKVRFLSLLIGFLGLAQVGAAAEDPKLVSCVEIKGPFGKHIAHENLVGISDSKLTVSLESRPDGWRTKNLYWTTSKSGLYYFGTAEDLNYALTNGLASSVSDSNWKEPSTGNITCAYSSGSGYDVLVICHEPYTYSVTFQPNGGTGEMTGMSGLSYTNDVTTLTKCAFTRTGYTFAGWTLDAAGSGTVFADQSAVSGASFGVTSDNQSIKLYAKWTPITYNVSYKLGDGTSGLSAPTSATYDSAFLVSPPEKTGSTFDGWTLSGHDSTTAHFGTDVNCGTSVGSDGKVSETGDVYFKNLTATSGGTVTLTARWNVIKTVVKFSREGGTGGTGSIDGIACGTSKDGYATIEPPTKTGETFLGYYTERNGGGTQYFDANGYLLRNWDIQQTAVTLYAKWSADTYTIAFNANGGSGTVTDLTVTYSQSFTLPSGDGLSHADSYRSFAGWSRSENGAVDFAAGASTSVSANKVYETSGKLTFYAVWRDNRKTVSVEAGSDGTASASSFTVIPGQPYGTLPTVTAKSYKNAFAGWFTKATDGEQISETDLVPTPAPPAIYAHWTNTWYTIRFNGNNSTSGEMDNQAVEFNVSTALSGNGFSRTGYAFAGWATTADATKVAYEDKVAVLDLATSANATVDLYAVWTANTYSVAFDANGGGGTMETLTAKRYDEAFTLPSCTFTAPSFSAFGGWLNKASGATYADGATVSNLTAEADATVTLTAVWDSTLTDLSRAMHCTNLIWESNEPSSCANAWEAVCEERIGHETDSCARQTAGAIVGQRWLAAKPGSVGVLSFWVNTTADKTSVVHMLSKDRSPADILGAATFVTLDKNVWKQLKIEITEADVDKYFLIAAIASVSGGACLIDGMTWIPGDGTVHPEPTADDAVEAASVTVADGTLSLSFTGDARFAYHLLATDSLSPISWYDFGVTNVGTGAAQAFAVPVDSSAPQRFFKVETIRRP